MFAMQNHCRASALPPRGRGECVSGASGVAAETGGAYERDSSKMSQKHVETL